MLQVVFEAEPRFLLRQSAGLRAAVGEEDHLSQLVEKLDGSSRELSQAPDGSGVNFLKRFSTNMQ